MTDITKLPEHFRRPPKPFDPDMWLKTKEFIDAIYERDRNTAIERGNDPDSVTRVGRSTVHRAILDEEARRINGAFFWNGTWWIHRSNLDTFRPLTKQMEV